MIDRTAYSSRRQGRSLENVVALALSFLATLGFGAFCVFYLSGFVATAA